MNTGILYKDAAELLKTLICIPSFSKEEDKTADSIERFLAAESMPSYRHINNVWCVNKFFNAERPTLLLNSHHDTVKPHSGYTRDPFQPVEENGKLYGLGSNDAGGCLVSLLAAFRYFYDRKDLKYNIIFAASAEEEISGSNGIACILDQLPKIEFAIVGEPTLTQLAIAEKGLLVLDCMATGKAGHAARGEGENAIYKAMVDMDWFRRYEFPGKSDSLGSVKMSVTSVQTSNKAHNVVPGDCSFVVDVRVTDIYSHEEILEIIRLHVQSEIKPRSMRIRSSRIDIGHPVVQAGIKLGKGTFGSPTTSDAALIPAPVLKCGPGDSARSHMADEYIFLEELEEGIKTYIGILEQIV